MSDYWSACTQLTLQIQHLGVKYPLEIFGNDAGLTVNAEIMFHAYESKAVVSFRFDYETFSRWPVSIQSIQYSIDVAYGNLP
jgi:hypothetical protein